MTVLQRIADVLPGDEKVLGFPVIFPYSRLQMTRFYHRTTPLAAEATLRNGFPCGATFRFLDIPFDTREGAELETALPLVFFNRNSALLLVLLDLDEDDLASYERAEPTLPQEWSIPGEVVNKYSRSVQIIVDPAIVQEDLRIKALELHLKSILYKSAASAIEKYHAEGIDKDFQLPEKELRDLRERRSAFEARLIANYPWNILSQ
jgi:hypothetical protein